MSEPNDKEIFKTFIQGHDVLIVDKNPSSRSRLIKIMSDLGSKRHMIHAVGSFQESVDIIATKNVGVILSDYFIIGGSGFDLFKLIREKNPNKKICLILVTANMAQSSVAKAAEEDVDSFVIKPYTSESIKENFVRTISEKVKPSQYIRIIEVAKVLIQKEMYDDALSKLQLALNLHPKPALALFYMGQAEYLKDLSDNAKGSFEKGLALNDIHFKCLSGLFDILMKRNKFDEAYQVVKKVATNFPANEDRLQQTLRLAIQTNNYEDMQFYYEIFTSLEERPIQLINYIGAGMFIAGKYLLRNNAVKDALRLFENIGISCSQFTKFPRAIISLLLENNLGDDAEKFLNRFAFETRNDQDYLISDYLVDSFKFNDPSRIVKNGLNLYNKNIRDFQCMQKMVTSMEECGYQKEKIEPFLLEMNNLRADGLTS